jgi:hypothetical protein
MPKAAWSTKREHQYEDIKDSLLKRGGGERLAQEIAARTVNKDRAQQGEALNPSAASVTDMSPERRGGLRSHRGAGGRTVAQLHNEARARGLKGRSKMSKAQLEEALRR